MSARLVRRVGAGGDAAGTAAAAVVVAERFDMDDGGAMTGVTGDEVCEEEAGVDGD